jgi:hypothetical protein
LEDTKRNLVKYIVNATLRKALLTLILEALLPTNIRPIRLRCNMSLAAKKDALFGGGGGNATAKPALSTQNAAGNNNTKPKSTLPPRKATSTVSAAVKVEKAQEAKQLMAEGEEYLKTSVFKWQPDYMGAAPKFSGASKAYAVAGEAALAHDMMLKSSKAYLGYDSTSAAANTLQEAAKLATTPKQKMEDLAAAAELWGQSGDVSRMAMTYVSVAETEGASEEEIAENLQVACNILVPPDSTEQDITNSRGQGAQQGLEVLQRAFKFYLTAKEPPRLEDAMKTSELLCRVSAAMYSDSVLWRTQAAITVLQLHARDVVAAEQTYIQEHLARAGYASSKEAEVVDELISAYRACDEEQLAAVQRSRGLFYLDREVKDLVRIMFYVLPSFLVHDGLFVSLIHILLPASLL